MAAISCIWALWVLALAFLFCLQQKKSKTRRAMIMTTDDAPLPNDAQLNWSRALESLL